MNKKFVKLIASLAVVFVAGSILRSQLSPNSVLALTFRYVQSGDGVRWLQFLMERSPEDFVLLIVYVFLCFLCIFHMIRIISLIISISLQRGASTSDHEEVEESMSFIETDDRKRYINQLDGYIKSGLIGHEEYKQLLRMYDEDHASIRPRE